MWLKAELPCPINSTSLLIIDIRAVLDALLIGGGFMLVV